MHFSHPRYWPIWIFYGLLRLISLLPYSTQIYLGRTLGSLLRRIAKKRRQIAEINLRLCFPDWTHEKRNEILKRHFESLGIFLFEFGIACWWSDKRLRPLAHVEGLENLQNALKKNKGAILLVAHFTTLVIISRALRLHVELNAMYRKIDNKLMDQIFKDVEERFDVKLIRHDDLKSMIRSLRNNISVIYIPDQNFGKRHSIFTPFFGIQTATIPATSRLAGIDNTPVIPIIQQRLPNNKGYRVVISKELDNFPGGDIEKDTIRLNQIIEEQVRQNPSEYLWIHRRFKTRPPGEKPIY